MYASSISPTSPILGCPRKTSDSSMKPLSCAWTTTQAAPSSAVNSSKMLTLPHT
jgi:hypothetical protein